MRPQVCQIERNNYFTLLPAELAVLLLMQPCMCLALISARVMITHHREVKKHRTLGSINSCCLMNARNLGMSKMKCLLPNFRGTLQMDSLLKQRALVTFPMSFHFAALKDGGS